MQGSQSPRCRGSHRGEGFVGFRVAQLNDRPGGSLDDEEGWQHRLEGQEGWQAFLLHDEQLGGGREERVEGATHLAAVSLQGEGIEGNDGYGEAEEGEEGEDEGEGAAAQEGHQRGGLERGIGRAVQQHLHHLREIDHLV